MSLHSGRSLGKRTSAAPVSYAYSVVSESDRDVDNSMEEVADVVINRGSDDSSDSN